MSPIPGGVNSLFGLALLTAYAPAREEGNLMQRQRHLVDVAPHDGTAAGFQASGSCTKQDTFSVETVSDAGHGFRRRAFQFVIIKFPACRSVRTRRRVARRARPTLLRLLNCAINSAVDRTMAAKQEMGIVLKTQTIPVPIMSSFFIRAALIDCQKKRETSLTSNEKKSANDSGANFGMNCRILRLDRSARERSRKHEGVKNGVLFCRTRATVTRLASGLWNVWRFNRGHMLAHSRIATGDAAIV